MVRHKNEELIKVFAKVLKGADLRKTWVAHGEPVSWGQCQRAWKTFKKAYDGEQAELAAARPKPARAPTSRVVEGGTPHGPPPSSGTATTTRTGASVASSTRRTSHQVETDQQNREAWRRQWSTAHKGKAVLSAEAKAAEKARLREALAALGSSSDED